MSNSESSEHESENSFDKNEDNKIDNLDELFNPINSSLLKNHEKSQEESSQAQKKNIFMNNHWENPWVEKIEWYTSRAESEETDCLCCKEVNAISGEQFSGNICDVLHI